MSWIWVLASVIVCWVASLCKILQGSNSSSKIGFLDSGGSSHKRNVLLVIAHPDDESMFFSPTISYLTSKGHSLHILCISTGDANGLGSRRKEELCKACSVFKVPADHVKVLDHPDLQDSFGKVWNHNLLAKIIEEEISAHGIETLITFDNHGVSGHCNHCDVHHGVRKLLYDSQKNMDAWEIASTNMLRKYSGPVDIWPSLLSTFLYPSGDIHCILNDNPNKSFLAMSQHRSQWIWFRKLFVSFSSYTYVNSLKKMK